MARAEPTAAPPRPRLGDGTRVRVSAHYPESGHIRAPFYLRGKEGRIVRYFGVFQDPTALATGTAAPPACHLYQVVFDFAEVWGDGTAESTDKTSIAADIYDPWLEPLS